MRLPYVKQPCIHCPFRKDTQEGWLGEERITEILDSTNFVCHKNIKLQCAGHMILNQKDNIFVSTAIAHGLSLSLKNEELVFDNKEDCINHHK